MIQITDKHVFFYTEWPSNYRNTQFMYKKHTFHCTEQAFRWEKAVFFEDWITEAELLSCKDGKEARDIGQQVKNFDSTKWSEVKYMIMRDVNYAKYAQDETLRNLLLDPKYDGKMFVEASPVDTCWGIGLSMDADGIDEETNWIGTNYMGRVVTDVRSMLLAMVKADVHFPLETISVRY